MRYMGALVLFLAATGLFGQPAPTRVFIDPSSRWMSLHDKDGSGAPLEMTLDIRKTCPSVIAVTDSREAAKYAVVFHRTGSSSGSVVIYAGQEIVHTFKPGHASSLQKVATAICEFVKKP